MKFNPGFDPEKGCLTFNIECQLIGKYFDILETIVKSTPVIKDFEIQKGGDGISAKISVPIEGSSDVKNNEMTSKLEDLGMSMKKVAINAEYMTAVNSALNMFINESLKRELSITEFIPISGYSWDSMREDIHKAVKNKRSFCVIQNYDEFLQMEKERKYVFHQRMVPYGTEEYADIAIMVYRDEQEKLKNLYTPKLELVDWC